MDWSGQRVAVVGLGISNRALVRYLARRGARVVACDQKPAAELGPSFDELRALPVEFRLGPGYLDGLAAGGFHTVFLTPGMRKDQPWIHELRASGVRIHSEMGLFFDLCRAPIAGVTGSSGKTTTTTLLGRMLAEGPDPVFVGGNIGAPLIEQVEDIPAKAWVVVELSSFQLELLAASPHMSLVTNISPNHLDLHGSMEAYVAAKTRIFTFQGAGDWVVFNADDPRCRGMAGQASGGVVWFSRRQEVSRGSWVQKERIMLRGPADGAAREVLPVEDVPLLGVHNLENVLAASALAAWCGASPAAIGRAVRSFTGVEHRLQLVAEHQGVRFYNDSIATTPHRARAGLQAFSEPVVLIAGGYDKGLPFGELARDAVGRVRAVVVLGATAASLAQACADAARDAGRSVPVLAAASLEEAVARAADAARPGDVVLLSPACASYDMFADFQERGRRFTEAVRDLTGKVSPRQRRTLP